MTPQAIPSERIIAGARFVLAIAALGLGLVYPDQPTQPWDVARTTLFLYFLYALVVIGAVDRSLMRVDRLALVTQVADSLWFPLILVNSQGEYSPFFLYYVFSLITASFRWGFRGALWVNTANVGLYALVHLTTSQAEFNFHAFMARPVYLYVLACLVGYLAEHQRRSQRQLIWLAEMSGSLPIRSRFPRVLEEAMEKVRGLFRAQQCILIIEEEGTGRTSVRKVAEGSGSGPYQLSGLSSTELEFLMAPRSNTGYLVNPYKWVARIFGLKDVMGYDFDTQKLVSEGFQPSSRLATLFEMESLLSVPVYVGPAFRGRLYLVNRPSESFSIIELQFLKLVVSQLAPLLENFRLLQNMQRISVLEEKNRIARDLHDGLLQSLAGLDLRLAACRRLFAGASTEVLLEFEGLQRIVRDEHMELRNYTKRLKTPSLADHELAAALRHYVETYEKGNAVKVRLVLPSAGLRLSRAVNREIFQIVIEALTNVHKHASASEVLVQIEQDHEGTNLTIEDNGRGFPSLSTTEDSQATKPWSIEGRTSSLKGRLHVESYPGRGTVLRISIPYDEGTRALQLEPEPVGRIAEHTDGSAGSG